MSTITKVFVILLALFSIAFTTMTVSVVARTANWKDTALKYEQHARAADTNLRNLISASAADLATARDSIRQHRDQIGDLETKLQSNNNELARMRTEFAQIRSEKSSTEAMNRGLLARLNVSENAREEYHKQRNDLEKHNIDLESRNIDLNDRVNELTAQVVVLLEEKRQFEQQVKILQDQNDKLSQASRSPSGIVTFESASGTAMTGVDAMSPVSSTPIRGRLVEMDGNLVTISVGSADGVKNGMVFVIHRNGEYVGDVKIDIVDPNRSAGRIVRSTNTPGLGDEVIDALGLASSRG